MSNHHRRAGVTSNQEKRTAYIFCLLFNALLTVNNVFADDDLAEYDPDQNLTVIDLLRDLLIFLSNLLA